MIIDAHIHVTPDGSWFHTSHNASVDTALRQMDRAGIARAAVIPMPGRGQREFAAGLIGKRSDRFITGFTINSLDDHELVELDEWINAGAARFLKVHPRQTGIAPLNPGLDPFLEAAQKAGLPVIFDTYIRGSAVELEQLAPFRYDELARRRPDLKIVLAHAGAHRVMDALAVAQTHPNVYLEMSHVLAYFKESGLEADFRYVMSRLDKKLIYGSDFPEYPMDAYLDLNRNIVSTFNNFDAEAYFRGNWARIGPERDDA